MDSANALHRGRRALRNRDPEWISDLRHRTVRDPLAGALVRPESYTRAVAHTLILVGLGWNGTGALVLGISGEIRWDWLPALIAGSLIGGYLGAHLSLNRGNRMVKRAFELLALLMGISLLIRSF